MRKTYPKDFKVQICRDILTGQKTVGEISKEYEIARPIVSRWLAEYKRYGNNAFAGKGNRLPEAARIYALEKENEQLKEELTILHQGWTAPKNFRSLQRIKKGKV